MAAKVIEWTVFAVAMLAALTVHEVAHGYVADRMGDPTPRMSGRLSLNPLKHLDFLGTLVFVMTQMVGWAKPVPVNPMNFSEPRRAMLWVSLAGPLANFALALVAAGLFRLIMGQVSSEALLANRHGIFILVITLNWFVIINVALGIFNMIPIPPLDGSNVLAALLPESLLISYKKFARLGPFLLILLILSPFASKVLAPAITYLHHLLIR